MLFKKILSVIFLGLALAIRLFFGIEQSDSATVTQSEEATGQMLYQSQQNLQD